MAGRRISDRMNVIAVTWNMTDHCNLSCANCNHASPLFEEAFLSFEQFKLDTKVLGEILHAEELKLLGGEPLLHPQLIEFMRHVKAIDLADKIRIISNAVLLHKVPDEFYELCDILELSIYPGVKYKGGGPDGLQLFREKSAKFDVELLPGRSVFRKTLLNNRIEDPVMIDAIYKGCGQVSKWGCHSIQDGRYYKCGPAPYLEGRLARRGEVVTNKVQDSVALHDNPNVKRELEAYLSSEKPLIACAYCLGDNGIDMIHHQLNKKGVIEENRANDGDILKQVYFPPVQQIQMGVRRKLLKVLS